MAAKSYFRTRFRVQVAERAIGDHWQGGPTTQKGAACPTCKKPLMLFWDINAQDPRLLKWNKNRFGGMKRLPLYYCWGCVGDLSYLPVSENEIRVLGTTGNADGGAEYDSYPESFPRQPIALLTEVSSEVKKAIKAWGTDGFAPTGFEKTIHYSKLVDFFGHGIYLMRCMFHHQFGGQALTETWDDETFLCPNEKCTGGIVSKAMGRRHSMRFLAGILNDPPHGLPMIEPLNDETAADWNYSISVQFHMCNACHAITAVNRCT